MKDILKNMDPEKRDRIINSALEEFSKNSYSKASTNNIIRNAEISKGLLFHYFKSKKALYNSLREHAMNIVIEAIQEKVDLSQTDFFERIKQTVLLKMQLTDIYPFLYEFIVKSYEDRTFEEITAQREAMAPGLLQKILTENIDFSKFRSDMDTKKVLSIITWTLERYGEEILNKMKAASGQIDMELLLNEFDEYNRILKQAFYKDQ